MSEITSENFLVLPDEKLVSLIKAGNNECFLILHKRYSKIIESIADKYASVCSHHDLIYYGSIGFADAVMSYRDDLGASFKTFAKICINSEMQDYIRKANADMRIPRELLLSIEDVNVSDDNDPESMFIKREYIDSLISSIKSKLSGFEYSVFYEFACGKSYKEIAAKTGKSEKAVENALSRARGKVREIKR